MFGKDFQGFEMFGGMGRGGFGGFRAGRGMMEPAILSVLLEKPMHGYEVISRLEEKSHGMWRPSAGSIYPTLQLLEEKEQLVGRMVDGKKVYELTDAGRTGAEQADKQHKTFWEDRKTSLHHAFQFREDMHESMGLIRDIVHDGNDEQKNRVRQAIAHFNDELQAIRGGR